MKKTIIEVISSGGTTLAGIGVGAAFGGPMGAAAGAVLGASLNPVTTQILSRVLSSQERTRIEQVADLSKARFEEEKKKGTPLLKNLNSENLGQLFEGILLKAKDSYESKKIPLYANLIARAPFTSTPIANLNQTLTDLENLSFRQVCILSIIDQANFPNTQIVLSQLSYQQELQNKFSEDAQGTYEDILSLIGMGILYQAEHSSLILIQSASQIIPSQLGLAYRGTLLCHGASLYLIERTDLQPVIDVLA